MLAVSSSRCWVEGSVIEATATGNVHNVIDTRCYGYQLLWIPIVDTRCYGHHTQNTTQYSDAKINLQDLRYRLAQEHICLIRKFISTQQGPTSRANLLLRVYLQGQIQH